jgi:Mlc titration factor MtfA (ptsG expression regulator)
LRSILVYPTAFWVDEEHQDEDGLVTRRREVLSGQAWDSSRIILAWEDISPAQTDTDPGYNVVLHEFAHYLDAEGRGLAPATDGSRIRDVADWSADLADEFDRMVAAVESGRNTFLDPYAAEDEAEFFAVASEEFLERPAELRSDHPALYALLREYYALDPASWTAYAAD